MKNWFLLVAMTILIACSGANKKGENSSIDGTWRCEPYQASEQKGTYSVMQMNQTFDINRNIGQISGKTEFFIVENNYPMLGIEYTLESNLSVNKDRLEWKDAEVDIVKVWGEWSGHFEGRWREKFVEALANPGIATFTLDGNKSLKIHYDNTKLTCHCKKI